MCQEFIVLPQSIYTFWSAKLGGGRSFPTTDIRETEVRLPGDPVDIISGPKRHGFRYNLIARKTSSVMIFP